MNLASKKPASTADEGSGDGVRDRSKRSRGVSWFARAGSIPPRLGFGGCRPRGLEFVEVEPARLELGEHRAAVIEDGVGGARRRGESRERTPRGRRHDVERARRRRGRPFGRRFEPGRPRRRRRPFPSELRPRRRPSPSGIHPRRASVSAPGDGHSPRLIPRFRARFRRLFPRFEPRARRRRYGRRRVSNRRRRRGRRDVRARFRRDASAPRARIVRTPRATTPRRRRIRIRFRHRQRRTRGRRANATPRRRTKTTETIAARRTSPRSRWRACTRRGRVAARLRAATTTLGERRRLAGEGEENLGEGNFGEGTLGDAARGEVDLSLGE